MSAFSVYWISGELHQELEGGVFAVDESQIMICDAVVHLGHYRGTAALVVTSVGETALIMADGIRSKGAV